MRHELLSRGIYAILNKELNMVYVGQTKMSFFVSWIEHLMAISDYEDQPKRLYLYLHASSKFIVLKIMDSEQFKMLDFNKYENEAQQFYVQKEWDVLSTVHYNPNKKERVVDEFDQEKIAERYRRVVKHMAYVLEAVNTKRTNGSFLLNDAYKKVEKHFKTDLRNRDGKQAGTKGFQTIKRRTIV